MYLTLSIERGKGKMLRQLESCQGNLEQTLRAMLTLLSWQGQLVQSALQLVVDNNRHKDSPTDKDLIDRLGGKGRQRSTRRAGKNAAKGDRT
jgi:hypothetical protein